MNQDSKVDFNFDPTHPLPRWSIEDCQRQIAKVHAEAFDAHLGFDIPKAEEKIRLSKNSPSLQESETWNHLSPQIFQTSYVELVWIFEKLKDLWNSKPFKLVDLGAGYFRAGLVAKLAFSDLMDCEGYEICAERVKECQRIFKKNNLTPPKIFEQNIALESWNLPLAHVYFIYDFGTPRDIQIVLNKIVELKNLPCAPQDTFASPKPSYIVGRGSRVRDALTKHYPWISAGQVFTCTNFSIWKL